LRFNKKNTCHNEGKRKRAAYAITGAMVNRVRAAIYEKGDMEDVEALGQYGVLNYGHEEYLSKLQQMSVKEWPSEIRRIVSNGGCDSILGESYPEMNFRAKSPSRLSVGLSFEP